MHLRQAVFAVFGAPQGKARPRVTRYGTYTPKKSREYEQRVREAWRQAGHAGFGTVPVSVRVLAHFAPPRSVSKAKRAQMLRTPPLKKPDADNILKAVCDALNGLAYDDDAQVCTAQVFKKWADDGEEAHIIVTVSGLEEDEA